MWCDGGYVDRLQGFRVVLFDHRGRGRSARPDGPDAHRMQEYAADVSGLADELCLDRFGFVGYSMGGSVGFEVAIVDQRLAAMVVLGCVFDPPGAPPVASDYVGGSQAAGMEGLIEVIESAEGLALPAWLREDFRRTDPRQFLLTFQANAGRPDPWEKLASLRLPVALIAGRGEDPSGLQDRMAAAMPDATSVHLPAAGHVGAFLRPDEVMAAALPILRRLT